MTEREQELMERYIYQVVRRLPGDQREEVALELRELISDIMEEKEVSVEEALTKLGDPAEFARRYQDASHCLIGPEYYDTYLWFVKIVLLCSVIPILITGIVDAARTGEIAGALTRQKGIPEALAVSVLYGMTGVIAEVLTAGLTAFGAVTLAFVFLERQKVKLEKKAVWTPGSLSPVPEPKARVSRGDCVVEIVFTVVFCMLLIFAPHFFSAVIQDGGTVTLIPVFNLGQWSVILPVFVLSLLLGLADDVVRLAAGVYGKAVLISNLVCNGVSLVLAVVLLKVLPFWNPDFASELGAHLDENGEALKILSLWNGNTASGVLLAVIFIAAALDTGTVVYKTLRYGRPGNF